MRQEIFRSSTGACCRDFGRRHALKSIAWLPFNSLSAVAIVVAVCRGLAVLFVALLSMIRTHRNMQYL